MNDAGVFGMCNPLSVCLDAMPSLKILGQASPTPSLGAAEEDWGWAFFLCSKEERNCQGKAELSSTAIPSCSLARPFLSQVKANKDNKAPGAQAVVFLAPAVREVLISSLSLFPTVPPASSRCWRVLHGQQPACGNNESKSGSAILYKPLSALRACICESARSRSPFSPFPLFCNPLLPPALVPFTRCRAREPGKVAQCCCSSRENCGPAGSFALPDAPGVCRHCSSGSQPAMSIKHQKPRSHHPAASCKPGKS